jgi:hypothetical protein
MQRPAGIQSGTRTRSSSGGASAQLASTGTRRQTTRQPQAQCLQLQQRPASHVIVGH